MAAEPEQRTSDPKSRWVTVDEFATTARMSVQSVYNRRSRGQSMPPAKRIGGRVLMRAEDVERWFEQQRDAP